MIKQRYIRHQAINKQGETIRYAIEVGGRIYPFMDNPKISGH